MPEQVIRNQDWHESLSVIDDRVVTWNAVESKLDKYLTFKDKTLQPSYVQLLLLQQSTKVSLVIFIVSHTAFLVFWFGRHFIFPNQPFGTPFQDSPLLILLDCIAIVVLISSILVCLTRLRPYIPELSRSYERFDIIKRSLECLDILNIVYTVSFTFFLSFQMLVIASLGSCVKTDDTDCNVGESCGGVAIEYIIFAFLSSIITRTFCKTSNRYLLCFNAIQSLIIATFTIIYYDFIISMGLLLILYILIFLMLYTLERRNRELFLFYLHTKTVLDAIAERNRNKAEKARIASEFVHTMQSTALEMKSSCTAMKLGLDSLQHQICQSPLTPTDFNDIHHNSLELVRNLHSTQAYSTMQNNRSMDFIKVHSGLNLIPVLETVILKHEIEWAISCVNWQNDDTIRLFHDSSDINLIGVTDKSWLKDNLLCIIDNANKYTHDEPVTVRVNIFNRATKEWIEILVTDNGPFTSNTIDRSFFFESPIYNKNKRESMKGTGLGLFCLAKRVTSLNGAYGANDRRDGKPGTVVWFRIPFNDNKPIVKKKESKKTEIPTDGAAAAISDPSQPTNAAGDGGGSLSQRRNDEYTPQSAVSDIVITGRDCTGNQQSSSGTQLTSDVIITTEEVTDNTQAGKKRATTAAAGATTTDTKEADMTGFVEKPLQTVLIVDDSIPIVKMASIALHKTGCIVIKAKNGLIGLEKMKENIYDLVIMDIQMPVMTGIECIKRFRKFENELTPQRSTRQLVVGVSANSEGK